MEKIIIPKMHSGTVFAPSSKSVLHRVLICAALSDKKTEIICNGVSEDVFATVNCLNSLFADISVYNNKITVLPENKITDGVTLNCNESGTTLRLLLPVISALGITCRFVMGGNLQNRPINALINELNRHGANIVKSGNTLLCNGKLTAGNYTADTSVSSQFVSGLLFALPLLNGNSTLIKVGKTVSENYILLTEDALENSGITFKKENELYTIPGNQHYNQKDITVEGDWSNAAFFLGLGAFSEKGITVCNLNINSKQGDKQICEILENFGANVKVLNNKVTVKRGNLNAININASQIPDLVPVISLIAANAYGESKITGTENLRLKESDRTETICKMLCSLGADISYNNGCITVTGKPYLSGGKISGISDHRIIMAAAVSSANCRGNVVISGAEFVNKSYPEFWNDFEKSEVNL